MQADTVLQHSRMYGARPKADLAVTRFYTSRVVNARLQQIHALETALREAFESGAHDAGVVFIQSDARGGIVPCAPSKISLSDVVAMRPNDILLPNGFDVVTGDRLQRHVKIADSLVPPETIGARQLIEIGLDKALEIIDAIEPTLAFDAGLGFDWKAMRGLLRYYSEKVDRRALLLAENGRELNKLRSGDRSGLSILGSGDLRDLIREPTRLAPVLVLLGQVGGNKLGWRAGPLWWPMLASPPQSTSCVFATKTAA